MTGPRERVTVAVAAVTVSGGLVAAGTIKVTAAKTMVLLAAGPGDRDVAAIVAARSRADFLPAPANPRLTCVE